MPRIISVSRKYLPALSNELSFDSSHRRSLGNLKPWGGGPEGVADRGADVEKAALHLADARDLGSDLATEVYGRARASAAMDR